MPPRRKTSTSPEPTPFQAQSTVAHRPLSLLEVQDSADLDALLLDPRLKGQIVSRLSPTFALLSPGSEKIVLEALRKAGHTPKVVGP